MCYLKIVPSFHEIFLETLIYPEEWLLCEYKTTLAPLQLENFLVKLVVSELGSSISLFTSSQAT